MTRLLILAKSIDGGTGTFTLALLKLSQMMDISIRCLVLEQPQHRIIKKKEIIYLKKNSYDPQTYTLSLFLATELMHDLWTVRKHISSYTPDIVLGVDVHANILVMLAQLMIRHSFKTILTTNNNLYATLGQKADKLTQWLVARIVRLFYSHCTVHVTPSFELSNHLQKNLGILKNQMVTIPYGIAQTADKWHRKSQKNIVISVGRLVEQKDFYTIIDAVEKLYKKKMPVQLWIVGDGNEKKKLQQYVQSLTLEETVTFYGWQTDIETLMDKADIFVFSSHWEGFGFTLLEAMSRGLPVITTNTPYGPVEIVNNGTYGMVCPMKDSVAISNAILKLLVNKSMYKSFAQKSLLRSHHFAQEKMLNQYKRLIQKLI